MQAKLATKKKQSKYSIINSALVLVLTYVEQTRTDIRMQWRGIVTNCLMGQLPIYQFTM